jgi:quercetin dioxygenase-like cupin family protein
MVKAESVRVKGELILTVNDLSSSVIFPLGEKNPFPFFTGQSYLNMLTKTGVPIGNVTFEPGCRNNWHFHPGSQILLVTGGVAGIRNGASRLRN